MLTRIHVNQHIIKHNRKTKEKLPPITVKTYKSNTKCSKVAILSAEGEEVAKVIYSPDKPLDCGATVYISTECEVIVLE